MEHDSKLQQDWFDRTLSTHDMKNASHPGLNRGKHPSTILTLSQVTQFKYFLWFGCCPSWSEAA